MGVDFFAISPEGYQTVSFLSNPMMFLIGVWGEHNDVLTGCPELYHGAGENGFFQNACPHIGRQLRTAAFHLYQ
jgi:hypothetical protein